MTPLVCIDEDALNALLVMKSGSIQKKAKLNFLSNLYDVGIYCERTWTIGHLGAAGTPM